MPGRRGGFQTRLPWPSQTRPSLFPSPHTFAQNRPRRYPEGWGISYGGVVRNSRIIKSDLSPPRVCDSVGAGFKPAFPGRRTQKRGPASFPLSPPRRAVGVGFKPALPWPSDAETRPSPFPLSPPRRAVGAGFKPAFPGRRTQKRGPASFPLSPHAGRGLPRIRGRGEGDSPPVAATSPQAPLARPPQLPELVPAERAINQVVEFCPTQLQSVWRCQIGSDQTADRGLNGRTSPLGSPIRQSRSNKTHAGSVCPRPPLPASASGLSVSP